MVRRWVALAVTLAVVAGVVVYLLARSGNGGPAPDGAADDSRRVISIAPVSPEESAVLTVLTWVPADAEQVTITDLDAIRDRLGVPDLTSADTMADRQAFWDRAEAEAVLLTGGLLRADNSELWLDYGFTQDDVDVEVRFTRPSGPGYVLALDPASPMGAVRRAVADGVGPLAGATVQPGFVTRNADVGEGAGLAADPALGQLVGELGESTYLRRGCIPFADALGTDATFEDQDAVLAKHDIAGLDDLPGVALSFDDDVATAWLGPGRGDLADRADLVTDWPTTGPIGFADGFSGDPAVDPSTGRIGFHVANPVAAANLTLTDILPFAVCNDATPLDEPTGL